MRGFVAKAKEKGSAIQQKLGSNRPAVLSVESGTESAEMKESTRVCNALLLVPASSLQSFPVHGKRHKRPFGKRKKFFLPPSLFLFPSRL